MGRNFKISFLEPHNTPKSTLTKYEVHRYPLTATNRFSRNNYRSFEEEYTGTGTEYTLFKTARWKPSGKNFQILSKVYYCKSVILNRKPLPKVDFGATRPSLRPSVPPSSPPDICIYIHRCIIYIYVRVRVLLMSRVQHARR